jgi:Uma2 family endonuclease
MATTTGTELAIAQEPPFPWPQVKLIETDGEPLESDWHRIEINLLIESVISHFTPRTDFYVGGNMFVYFSEEQALNRDYRGPDFFFVWGVSLHPLRPYWAIWKERGHYPDVIIELLSPSTAIVDRTVKKQLYERLFHTREYFCYDPDTRLLEGWRLGSHGYEALVPAESGRLQSEELGLWLGTWQGVHLEREMTWLRFFTPEGNLVQIPSEAERQRAEAERQRAEAERQRAEAEQQRAEAEQQRAEVAEAESARLRAELERLKGGGTA